MEYILFSFIFAGLPTLYTGVCNKMRELLRVIALIVFIVTYYINKWETADINVGLFICWCGLWTMVWDYLYRSLENNKSKVLRRKKI